MEIFNVLLIMITLMMCLLLIVVFAKLIAQIIKEEDYVLGVCCLGLMSIFLILVVFILDSSHFFHMKMPIN